MYQSWVNFVIQVTTSMQELPQSAYRYLKESYPLRRKRSWGSVLLIIFYVENLDVGSWGVKNDV